MAQGGEELRTMSFRSEGACSTLITVAYTSMIRILKVKKNMIRMTAVLFLSSHPLIQQLNEKGLRKPLLCARLTSTPTVLGAVKYTNKSPQRNHFSKKWHR